MTAIPQPGSSRAVSDRIAGPLRQVAARQWNVVAATGVLKTLAAALALLLLTAVVLGTAATLPAAPRIVLAAAAWVLVAISGVIFLKPALRRRTLADAAFTVEQRTPGLDERLSSTVQLSSEPEPFAGSPALLRHLARQAEADAAAVRPDLVVPAEAVKRWAIVLAPLLLLWLSLAALFPRPLLGGLYRTLMPWKEHLPAVLTRISVTPGHVTVAEGDALEIKASIHTSSGSETEPPPPLLLTAPLAAADAHPLARDLQRLSPREFRASFDSVLQSFRYRVSTDQGESPWFTATVLPRPAVAALDLRYDYPPYARLDARTVTNADGDVRALQGTDVTLTLHASKPLDLAPGKSRITVTEGTRQRTLDLRTLDGQPNVYEAKLTVFNSGSYRIQLVNRHGLTNKDERPRTIAAELDQPPKVALTSPESQVTVRPDDDVPVAFKASDDFGVAKIVALIQVDDKPAEERDVPAPPDDDRRQIDGRYLINVADTLARAGVDEAKTITYWLRVTDNRDPDPQSAESARQTLKVDKYQQLPYRARVEQDQAKDLTQAIDKAIQRLNQSEGQVNSLKSIDPQRPMNPDEKRRSDEQRDQLGTTSKELADAAESNRRTSFGAVAEKARQVAEGPIQSAAEDIARSRLSDDQPEARNKAVAQAAEQIVDARKRLEELKKGIEARAREVQSGHELEKLAERQTRLAEAQAKATPKPKKDDADPAAREAAREAWRQAQQKLQQRQRELLDRLNRAIGQDESLRNPKAVEQATKLRELLDRVQQIQKDQGVLQEQVAKDEQVTALREQSDDLAARQQKLNDEIEAFSEKRHATLRTADARTPDRSHQAAIIDHLRKGQIDPARERQKQSVEQLKEAARKLDERGRSNELKADPVQQNALNLQEQAKQAAQQVASQAQQAGEKLKQAKAAKDASQAAQAKKDVDEAAQKLAKQAKAAEAAVAEALKSDDATAKKNAEDARSAANAAETAADAARQAAQRDDAEEAAKKLDESAKQLAAARQKAAEAVKADFVDDQRDAARAAAAQAKELAERQKQLADAAKENAEALAKARKDRPSLEDVASRQGQLKDQTNQAKQQAEQLEQLAKADKSPLAERVEGAKKLLDAAIADQAEAAQAEQSNAQAHRQIGQLLQQAGEADQQKAQVDQQSAQAAEQADSHEQQAEAARQSQADAEARGDADAARVSKEQADREKRQADQDEQRAKQIEAQAEAPRQRAAEGLKQVTAARSTATASRRKAAEKQAAAQDALARAEDVLRDVDRMAAASASRKSRPKPADAKRRAADSTLLPDAAADADAAQRDLGDPLRGGKAPREMTPEEAARQAARGAQEAAQSQQQALNNANDASQSLDASRQAAAALQEAAAAMAAANAASSAASTDSVATAPEEQTPSQGLGKGEQVGRPSSARALESRNGIGVSAGGTDDRPASVQQLGISAGDWARLGPLTRQELLNAAQQSGPPAYREMIKNYYVRIAKLDREGRSNGPQSQTPTEPRNGKKR